MNVFELTIREKVYQFIFGMGFMREINGTLGKPIDGIPGAKQNIGMRYKIACLFDYDPEALVDILLAANKGQTPRITKAELDEYIDICDDIDGLFESVIDFLEGANVSKKITKELKAEAEKMKAEAEAKAKAK